MPTETPVHRVLVVDDEPDITALVAYHLAKEGYRSPPPAPAPMRCARHAKSGPISSCSI